MGSGLPAHVEEADLISYGLGGLISAIERFDLSREIKFETYAITRIRGAIIDELRTLDWVPRSVRARAREFERANMKLEARLQRAPTDEEMSTELEHQRRRVPGGAAADLQLDDRRARRVVERRRTPPATRSRCSTRCPTAARPTRSMLVDQSELRDRIADAIAALPEREKLVVALYYYENLTLREIGEVLGVTESRVSQLHTKAVLRLRSKLASELRLARGSDAAQSRMPFSEPSIRSLFRRSRERRSGMHKAADRIRNVALVGHRGSGKTSLHEALLFQAGAVNRLGSVVDGTTVSDSDADEKSRQMSISAALSSFEWQDRKVNLIDTPGDSSFVADALGALRVCESAVFVINAVMGVEVHANRLWQRAAELDLARLMFVNMLDRERADFFRTLDSLKSTFGQHVVATEIPIGSEHEVSGVIDLIDMKAYSYDAAGRDNCEESPDPRRARRPGAGVPREADGRGRRSPPTR